MRGVEGPPSGSSGETTEEYSIAKEVGNGLRQKDDGK